MNRTSLLVIVLLLGCAFLAPEPLTAQADPRPGEERRRTILDALERLELSAYVQAQYVQDESSRDELSGGSTRNRDQFSVRRGRLKLVYTASEIARLTVAVDASSSDVVLKDAFIELTEPWTEWRHTLTAGQFNRPFGLEISRSSSDREMPERARVIRSLFPGERDRGVMASGAGFGKRLSYRVAVVNGEGVNQPADLSSDKDLIGRVGWKLGTLELGGSVYRGHDLVATPGAPSGVTFDKNRTGLDIQWRTPLPGLRFRGEYLTGDERGAEVDGWYLYAIQAIAKHQLALRVDAYDSDTAVADDAVTTIGGAWLYDLDRHVRLMAAYEHPERERGDVADDVVTLRLQFRF
ncbi:MAG TPA: porin [Thermoanaerobaculia bacterium]|nr:porin [Thermoanaerobaculia bacterium]